MPRTTRKLHYAAAFVIVCCLLLSAGHPLADWLRRRTYRQPMVPPETNAQIRTTYEIAGEFYPMEQRLITRQQIEYRTPERVPVPNLVLHLYPNAFSRPDALPQPRIAAGQVTEQLLPGSISVTQLSINGQLANYEIKGTILSIPLSYWHLPDTPVLIQLECNLLVPTSVARLGVFRGIALFGNWYPIMAINDRGNWRKDPYYPLGDPFYSDTADYRVDITMPSDYQAVSTGLEVSRTQSNNLTTYSWYAQNVRDFAWSASNRYHILERQTGGVLVRSAYFGERRWGLLALDLATRAIEVYERLFGPYQYASLTVAEAQLRIFGGMEYPGFVVMSPYGQRDTTVAEAGRIEREIAHEVAHQWWYASVGNDQILEPWLDEATATYVTTLYFAEVYGPQELQTFRQDKYATPMLPISSPLTAFREWREYWLTVYVKGSYLLDELSLRVGQAVFLRIMQDYYQQFSGRIAHTDGFIRVISVNAGPEHATWFAERLMGP